ncbi:MAG: hypothetical protein ACYS74_18480 [Planctomycetota bacterium]|jgi:hypothetical protein
MRSEGMDCTGSETPAPSRYSDAGYASTTWSVGVVALCFVTGTLYVPIQWHRHGDIKDAAFVSMLIAATMILMFGLRRLQRYIVTKGLDFYSFVMSTSDPEKAVLEHDQLCASVINFRRMTIAGILYGMAIGSTPFVWGVWKDDVFLRSSLSLFMFFVNFATGVAFYGLLTFFCHAIKMGAMVKIDLWHVENPSTNFLLGATRRLSVLASIYVCISISSILFSVLPIGSLVIGYSCFSAGVILASLAVPTLPVAKKLRESKAQTLRQIDEQVQAAFAGVLAKMNSEDKKVDLTAFESLLQLREKVESVHTWPFKLKALSAGFSVVFFSSVPVVLQLLLEKVFK